MTYETQGACDFCDVAAGSLVNGLVLCACLGGFGAPWEVCQCDWGRQQRKKRRSTQRPPVSSHTETGENPECRGPSEKATEAAGLGEDCTPRP